MLYPELGPPLKITTHGMRPSVYRVDTRSGGDILVYFGVPKPRGQVDKNLHKCGTDSVSKWQQKGYENRYNTLETRLQTHKIKQIQECTRKKLINSSDQFHDSSIQFHFRSKTLAEIDSPAWQGPCSIIILSNKQLHYNYTKNGSFE